MNDDPRSAMLLAALREAVGPAGFVVGDETARYVEGARYGGGKALCVVRPAASEEAAAVVALCAAHGVSMVPQGANTGLVGASTPDTSGTQVVLSLDRLRGHCEVDVVNRTVEVDAGVLLHELNDKLEAHGLWFPIDLAADPSIGGMISANAGGTRLLRHGDVRHNLLAVEAVLFDPPGRLVRFGAPLRKNNTGFDLMQLFVGTSGASGVITRATLEVARKPRQSVTCIVVPASDSAVESLLVDAEEHLGEFLSAFEGLSRSALQSAISHVPSLRNPFAGEPLPEFCLLIEVSSCIPAAAGGVDLEGQLLAFLEERLGGVIANAVMGRGNELWQLRHSLSDGARALGKVIGFDIAVRRSDVMRFRREATALIDSCYPQLKVVDFGHVGDGGLHFNLVWPHDAGIAYAPDVVEQVRTEVYDLVVTGFGGSYSAEHGVGPHNHACYLKYTDDDTLALSGRLARLLDPRGLGGRVRFGRPESSVLPT
jgi:FAD/FMN-containing dehydrogenase